jgi:hypothetical protein
MALLNGKQIKDTSVALDKLNGSGLVAISGSMSFTTGASLTIVDGPQFGFDATNKAYVDEEIALAIAGASASADTLTTDLLDEIARALLAEGVLSTSISAEVVARTNGDATLSTAVSNEISNRIVADASLTTSVTNEVSSRIAADASLTTSVTNEVSSRIVADASLATEISIERVRTDAILLGSTASLNSFLEVVTFVNNIDSTNDGALTAAVAGLTFSISTETARAISAENSIAAAITLASVTEDDFKMDSFTGSGLTYTLAEAPAVNNEAVVTAFVNGLYAPIASVTDGVVVLNVSYTVDAGDSVSIKYIVD